MKRDWSALKLAVVAHVMACTTSAILAVASMVYFEISGLWFVAFCCYIPLVSNTAQDSPVHRHGGKIKGMIFVDHHAYSIDTTVRAWFFDCYVGMTYTSLIFATMTGILAQAVAK